MRFEKWQALGNDYLIVERADLPFELTPARVRRLCQAHFGVFADGVLELSPPSDPGDVADLRIFNPDGSRAELSGNGAREAVLYLRRRGWTELDSFSIHTDAGPIAPQITGPFSCRIDMGRASLTSKDFPGGPPDGAAELRVDPAEPRDGADPVSWSIQHVSIGNPQCAIRVVGADALRALDLAAIGPALEAHPEFPNRTNVSWYAELDPGPPARIRARRRRAGRRRAGGGGRPGPARPPVRLGAARVRGAPRRAARRRASRPCMSAVFDLTYIEGAR
jgi:diaminopimelate epimerase